MIKKNIIIFSIVFILSLSLISSSTYGGGLYGADLYGQGTVVSLYCGDGICNNGETTTTCSADCDDGGSGGGGGGGETNITAPTCLINEDCSEGQFCLEGFCRDYECYSDSDCNVEEGESCFENRCVKLFDVEIKDFESPVPVGEFFDFTYLIKGMAEINADVKIEFWIEKDGKNVTSGQDIIYLSNYEEKIKKSSLFLPNEIESGIYTFYVQVGYETYYALSSRIIEIQINEKGVATIELKSKYYLYIPYIIAGIIFLMIIIIGVIIFLAIKRKREKELEPVEQPIVNTIPPQQ